MGRRDFEEVELRPGRDPAAGAAAEDGQAEGEEQVLEDLDVALGALASHGAIAGQVGDVQQSAVGEGDRFEETRELADVAHQSFRLDLLPKVEGGIRPQRVRALGGAPYQGQHALAQSALEVETAAQLGRHEGRHDAPRRPAAEQVDPALRILRALEPVRAKTVPLESMRAWTTSSSSGAFCTSSMTTGRPSAARTRSRRRSGRASRSRWTSGWRRSTQSASGKRWRSQVDLPVPRGPKRKKLRSGGRKNRCMISIFGPNLEVRTPN